MIKIAWRGLKAGYQVDVPAGDGIVFLVARKIGARFNLGRPES